MPLVFRARSVVTPSGTFGHLRIFTFSVQDPVAFVDEFVRLVGLLPQNGLIVDVRGNGGGHIFASEFTLQTLTPRRITPEPVQFICTPLNLEICRRHKDNPTGRSTSGRGSTRSTWPSRPASIYSAALPITPEDGANDIGQRTSARSSWSPTPGATRRPTSSPPGSPDHEIGPILGVDDNTGAGGANVWTHGLLAALRELPPPDRDLAVRALPTGRTCGWRSGARSASASCPARRSRTSGSARRDRTEMTRARRAREQRRPAEPRRRAARRDAGPPARPDRPRSAVRR